MDITRPDAGRHDDETPRRPRGRKLKRWAAFVLLLLVVGLAAGYLTWSQKSERRLDALVAELRRAGEPVEPQDLIQPPIPSEHDAAADLFAAAALLDKQGAALEAFGRIDLGVPLRPDDRATIDALVEGERDALEKVRTARGKRGADWRIVYRSPALTVLLPHLNDVRLLANLSRAAALRERLRGNDAAALDHFRDVLAIGEACDTHPFMVGHLVALGVRAVATQGLGEMAPGMAIGTGRGPAAGAAGGAAPEHVRATIRELLDEQRSAAGFHAALRGERVIQLDTARLLADRKLDLRAVTGGAAGAGGFTPPLPRGMILADAHLMATQVGDLIEAYEKSPDYQAYKRNAPPPVPAPLRQNRLLHVVASVLMPAYDRFVLNQFRSQADRRLTAVALALRLYAADHDGKYPQSLEQLVPAYLPAVPKDPFAAGDQLLSYSVADPAAPVVYSVGENGRDDGASEMTTRRGQAGAKADRWQAIDAVLRMKPEPLTAPMVEDDEPEEETP